jgi:hypothetical protein
MTFVPYSTTLFVSPPVLLFLLVASFAFSFFRYRLSSSPFFFFCLDWFVCLCLWRAVVFFGGAHTQFSHSKGDTKIFSRIQLVHFAPYRLRQPTDLWWRLPLQHGIVLYFFKLDTSTDFFPFLYTSLSACFLEGFIYFRLSEPNLQENTV